MFSNTQASVDAPQTESTPGGINYERNLKGLTKYLLSSYNNSPVFLIDVVQSAAKFAKRMRFGGPRAKKVLDIMEYGTPAVVLTSDLFSKLRHFHKITTEKPNVYNEKEIKIRKLLGCHDPEKDDSRTFIATNFDLGKDICIWISGKPKTKEFVIEGFYKGDLQYAKDLWDVEHGNVFVLIDFEERKFVWELSYIKFDDKLTINNSVLFYLSSEKEGYPEDESPANSMENESVAELARERLKNAVFKDFLRHFDVSNNVIYISKGLQSRRRMTFEERINQYDIESFGREVRKVLKRGCKRGYAFVGVPGTGKSTIIRKLEGSNC